MAWERHGTSGAVVYQPAPNSIADAHIIDSAAIKGRKVAQNRSATPPGSPDDGDIWIYPFTESGGGYWMFIYDDNAATYKWKFVGGGHMCAGVDTLELANAGGGAWVDLTAVTLTIPRAGYYRFSFVTRNYLNAGAPQYLASAIKLGAAVITGSETAYTYAYNNGTYRMLAHQGVRLAAASDVWKLQYYDNYDQYVLNRQLSVQPICVI